MSLARPSRLTRVVLLALVALFTRGASAHAQGPRAAAARVGVAAPDRPLLAPPREAPRYDPDRSRHEMVGALIGSAVGTVALIAVIGADAARRTNNDGPGWIMGFRFLPVAVVSGAFVGAVIGHLMPSTPEADRAR